MEKISNKVKAHTVYKLANGTRVPGVTTILGILNKPALVAWANRLGLQGIDSTKYVDEKADIGTLCHYLIECDLRGEKPDLSEYAPKIVDQAENGYLKWLDWKAGKNIEILGVELELVSEAHRFGGKCDAYLNIDGKKTLLDIKTSGSGIWPEMKHQTAGGYRLLLEENGYPVEAVRILRVGRDASEGFEEAQVLNWEAHTELFLCCRKLYDLQKDAK